MVKTLAGIRSIIDVESTPVMQSRGRGGAGDVFGSVATQVLAPISPAAMPVATFKPLFAAAEVTSEIVVDNVDAIEKPSRPMMLAAPAAASVADVAADSARMEVDGGGDVRVEPDRIDLFGRLGAHWDAHEAMLLRAGATQPVVAAQDALVEQSVADAATSRGENARWWPAVRDAVAAPKRVDSVVAAVPVAATTIAGHDANETSMTRFGDAFKAALAEQEAHRESVQVAMHDHFLAHQAAHDAMLARASSCAVAEVSDAPVAAVAMHGRRGPGRLLDALASMAPVSQEFDAEACAGPTSGSLSDTLISDASDEAMQPLDATDPPRVGDVPVHADAPARAASQVGPGGTWHRLGDDAAAADGATEIAWQSVGTRSPARRRKEARVQGTRAPARKGRAARALRRVAAMILLTGGAYFAAGQVSSSWFDLYRLADLDRGEETRLVVKQDGRIATGARAPREGAGVVLPPLPTLVEAPALPVAVPVQTADAAPREAATGGGRFGPVVDASARPHAGSEATSSVPGILVIGNTRGEQELAGRDTINNLLFPPVLIHKRQQISSAVRTESDLRDGHAAGARQESLARVADAQINDLAPHKTVIAAIVPPKPKLVRESLIRTAGLAPPRGQLSDAPTAVAMTRTRPRTVAADEGREVAKAGDVNAPRKAVRKTRVAVVEPQRPWHSNAAPASRTAYLSHAHAPLGLEVREMAPRTARAAALDPSLRTDVSMQRGQQLYARATLGRGQHGGAHVVAADRPAPRSFEDAADAYINVFGFRLRRTQPYWARPLLQSQN